MSLFEKTIDIDLTPASIRKAIREINAFEKKLEDCCNELIQVLSAQGAVIAKMNVMHMNAVYTGRLEESIQAVFFQDERMGVIFTDVPYAIYVEYGTGIVGEAQPHPEAGAVEWEYDSHGHGESGWWYYGDFDGVKQLRWTKGMISRPFMYETLRWLEANAPSFAGNTFGKLGG